MRNEDSRRDLASPDPWERSLERSRHRRSITPEIRRQMGRRRKASAALTTLMVAGPAGQVFAATGTVADGKRASGAPPAGSVDLGRGGAMMFKLGSNGAAVEAVQKRLSVTADGVFGPITERAVRDFQARNGLQTDGVVGPITWTKLFGLEEAALGAGAAKGDVAVIVRERPAAESANAAAPAPVEARTTRQGAARSVAAPKGSVARPVEKRARAPRASDESPAKRAMPERNTREPDTKAVAKPAPTTPVRSEPGACGSLRLSTPVKGLETSPFGPRGGRNHDGVDIAAPSGTPVRAAECGTVTFQGVQGGYGNMVCIKHSDRLETCYAHLSGFNAANGQTVRRGQVIGFVGCTGHCTGPHVHFETRVDGSAQDPTPYLRGAPAPGNPTVQKASTAGSGSSGARKVNGKMSVASVSGGSGSATAASSSSAGVSPRARAASPPPVAATVAPQGEAAPVAEPVAVAPVAEAAPVAEPVAVAPVAEAAP
ncbi:MAG: peptidoglycan DD-metalloendopeptidase family protein, partial [Thermoleophilaceae bacterium]|nr:peptidoglycan DD-metalloendopeptidase family protein [Thermoleophilaceae bacterium]